MESNLKRFQSELKSRDFPCALVSNAENLRWMLGFNGSFGFAIITPNQAIFVTDSRYKIQALSQVKDAEVISFASGQTLLDVLKGQFSNLNITKLGFESGISFATYEQWKAAFSGIEMVSLGDTLNSLRKIKAPWEITKIKESCKLADACIQHASRMIQVGVSEFDIGLDIEFFFRRNGALIGFDPIVASGANSAKPHGRATEKLIERGDFVTLDLGGILDGYASDITRTYIVGEASERHSEIYKQVLRAEEEAIQMLHAGKNGREADQLARDILNEKDLGQYFGHSLGHGLGCDVHDPGRLHFSADEPLAVGQVWTVEPGVYIEGFGGVRIEDDVLITESGPEILTITPKHLTVL